ncbi:MAG: hypothetical protein KA981_06430 [Bacteroidia bacterium]|jgi:hypothetical protein|nr:hypothetical protein [Bacteroidia bacterium]
MNRIKILLLVILIGLNFNTSFCQNYVDLINGFYTNTPLNQFDSSLKKTRVQDINVSVLVPKKLSEKNTIILGLETEWMYAALTPTGNSGSVSSFGAKIGLNKQLSDKWNGTMILIPKLASDFKNSTGGIVAEDFQLGLFSMFKYSVRTDKKYKVGLYYNGELFGPFFSPIIGLYYKGKNGKTELDLSLPFLADFSYQINNKVKIGSRFNAFVRTFHLHDYYYHSKGEYLAKTSNEMFGYACFEPKKGFLVKANIGYSIGRNYRLYDIEDKVAFGLSAFRFGDKRHQLNADFADGLLFRIELIYRYYTH